MNPRVVSESSKQTNNMKWQEWNEKKPRKGLRGYQVSLSLPHSIATSPKALQERHRNSTVSNCTVPGERLSGKAPREKKRKEKY